MEREREKIKQNPSSIEMEMEKRGWMDGSIDSIARCEMRDAIRCVFFSDDYYHDYTAYAYDIF